MADLMQLNWLEFLSALVNEQQLLVAALLSLSRGRLLLAW